MARTRTLQVVITGDAKDLTKAFKSIDQTGAQAESRAHKVGRAMAVMGTAAAGAAVIGLTKSAKAAIDAQQSQARLEAQMRASNISFRAHAREIDRVIQRTSRLAGIDDEDLQDAFTNIVRSTGSVSKGLANIGLAADIARAKHIDVAKAGQLLGRVATGNVTALSRYGIQIDKNATSTQALAELQRRFAGQAAAYGRTTQGAIDRTNVAFENLQEAIGARLLPMLTRFANRLNDLIAWMGRNRAAARALGIAVGAVTAAFVGALVVTRVAAAFATMRKAVLLLNASLLTNPVVLVTAAIVALGVALVVAYKRSQTFRDVVNGSFRAVKDTAHAVASVVSDLATGAFSLVTRAAGKVASAVGSIKRAFDAVKGAASGIGGALKGAAGALNPFGDGAGRTADNVRGLGTTQIPSVSGVTGGNLMGAQAGMAPIAAIGSRFGLGVSSGRRPGSITSSGNISFHSSGEALDEAGPPGNMLRFFRYMKSHFGSRLAELIHTPGGIGVKNGQPYRYTGKVAADHFDHVHVAMDLGRPGIGDGIGRRPFTGDGLGNARQIARFLRGQGFSTAQVAGVLGNLRQESNFDPTAVENQGRGPGIGIAQWSFGRAAALKAFARRLGKPWTNLGVQLAFMMREFRTSESRAFRGVRSARSVEEAERAFGLLFERYGVMGNRSGRQFLSLARSVGRRPAGRDTGAAPTSASGGGVGGVSAPAAPAGPSAHDQRISAQREADRAVNPYDQRIASADLAIAEAQGARNIPSSFGDTRGRVSSKMRQAQAISAKRRVVGDRIRKVRAALRKKGVRPTTRLRLTQELAQLLGEHRQLEADRKQLLAPPDVDTTGGGGAADVGGGGGGATDVPEAPAPPTEIDFINAMSAQASLTTDTADDLQAATALQSLRTREYQYALGTGDPRLIAEMAANLKSANDALQSLNTQAEEDAKREEAEKQAREEHTAALKAVADELKRQTDFAQQVQTTEAFQLKKYLADVISGEVVGRGAVARSYTPGRGTEFAY